MIRVSIQLDDEVISALRILAKREMRDYRKQAALIIREELARQGLIDLAGDIPDEDDKSQMGEEIND